MEDPFKLKIDYSQMPIKHIRERKQTSFSFLKILKY